MKRCSILLIIKERQIKTAIRYHLMLVRMAIIKKSTNNKCWRGYGEKGTLLHCWWEWKLMQPLCKTVWRFLKKLGIKLPYDPTTPLLGIKPEKSITERDTCIPVFIAVKAKVAQSCPIFGDPMDCSLPGFSVHGILQARILEWVAIPFSRRSSEPRSPAFLTIWATGEVQVHCSTIYNS